MRRSPLNRGWPIRRSARALPAKSEKMKADEARRAAVRVRVFERDKWRCVVSQFPETKTLPKWPKCFGGLTVHHLHKASALGPYTEDNLVTLCTFHNEYVESHHAEAQALGLEVRP